MFEWLQNLGRFSVVTPGLGFCTLIGGTTQFIAFYDKQEGLCIKTLSTSTSLGQKYSPWTPSMLEYTCLSLSETHRGWNYGPTPLLSLRAKACKVIPENLPWIRAHIMFKLGHANFPTCIIVYIQHPINSPLSPKCNSQCWLIPWFCLLSYLFLLVAVPFTTLFSFKVKYVFPFCFPDVW